MTGPAVVVVLLLVLVWVVLVDVPERLPVVALSTHSIASPRTPFAPLYKLPRMGMLSILLLSHDSLSPTHSSAVLAAFLTLSNAPEKAVPILMLTSLNFFQSFCAVSVILSPNKSQTAIKASTARMITPIGFAFIAILSPVCAVVAAPVAAACAPVTPIIVPIV